MKRKMKETAFTGTAPSNGIGVAQAQAQARANALHVRTHTRAGARTELGSQTWHQNQGNQGGPSREDLGATNFQDFRGAPSTVPPGGSSCSSSAMGAMGVMGATLTPSLAGRPCRRDYSDLASILMDSAPRENSVDAESDLVTLGGDPYSDYSLSGTPHIMPYNSDPADEYWNPARASHSPDEDDKGGLSDLDGMAAVPPELEPFGPGIGDPCDPYWA
ncbi:unnamed protein product [Ascophyllum nodosum]